MFEKTIVKVAMNGQGVLHRRGFMKGIGLGAAGLMGCGKSWAEAGADSAARVTAAIASRVWSMEFPAGRDAWILDGV